jgi:hypothetical protein
VSPHAFINGGNRFKDELLAEDNENKRLIVESIKIVFCPSGTFDLEFLGNKNLSDPPICEQYAVRLSISSCQPLFATLTTML